MPSSESDDYGPRRRIFRTRFCERCQAEREFSKREAPHRFHAVLTVLTLGLWGVGWAAVAVAQARRPWRCTTCNARYVPLKKRNPYMQMPVVPQPATALKPRKTSGTEDR